MESTSGDHSVDIKLIRLIPEQVDLDQQIVELDLEIIMILCLALIIYVVIQIPCAQVINLILVCEIILAWLATELPWRI